MMVTVRQIIREYCKDIVKISEGKGFFEIRFRTKKGAEKFYQVIVEKYGSALVFNEINRNYYKLSLHKELMRSLIGDIVLNSMER